MSKFLKLLNATLEKYGYIPSPDKGEEFNELVIIFEEKENYSEFLEKIELERKDGSSSSLLRLLKGIISQGKITENNLIPIIIELVKIEENNEHFDATLIDIFFELSPTREEKEEYIKIILSKQDKKYIVYESLLIHVTKFYTEDDVLFCNVYLESLNSKRGNYIGVHWFQEAYIRIAKSTELPRFIETLYTPEYKKAFALFIDGNEETLRLFFENIPPIEENFELFRKILSSSSEGEDPEYILSDYHGYNKKIFLDAVFAFLSKSGKILPFVKDFLGSNYGIFETREYIAHYMALEEVAELGGILADKLWGVVQMYEYIEVHTTRTDKEKILAEIEKIPGFDEEMEKTRLSREKYEQEEQERKNNKNKQTIESIRSLVEIDKDDATKISPALIDLYKKHKELFTKEQVEVAEEHLKRFFAWELFPLDKISFSRTQTAPGSHSYSYSNNIWYREGFFLDTLEIASELGVPYPSHDTLIRSLAIIWTGEGAKKHLIPAIGSLTRDDILVLKSVYDGSRTDDLCEFMGGQNFFELYRSFEFDWKGEKDILREILYAFIEKHDVEDNIRETALQILTADGILKDDIDRPFLESLWEKEIAKYPGNLVERYERRYSYIFSINQVLINLGDEDAIIWRFEQLLNAKVDFPDPWENHENDGYARGISDLEDELSHNESGIVAGLGNIDLMIHKGKIEELLKHGLEIISSNKMKYGLYGSYLIYGIFRNLSSYKDLSSVFLVRQNLHSLIDLYRGTDSSFIGQNALGKFYDEIDKRIHSVLGKVAEQEAELKNLKPKKILIIEDEKVDTKKLWEKWLYLYGIKDVTIYASGGCGKFDVETTIRELQKKDSTYCPKIFRIVDRDGFDDDAIEEYSSFFNQKEGKKLGCEYRLVVLPVCEIENFAVKKREFTTEEMFNLCDHLRDTLSQRFSELKKWNNQDDEDKSLDISTYNEKDNSQKISRLLEKARSKPELYLPGKEQNPNAVQELLKEEGISNEELLKMMDEIKRFYIDL